VFLNYVTYPFWSTHQASETTLNVLYICCYCSVAQSCPTLCDPVDCSTPGSPVLHHLLRLLKLMAIESVMPSNHLFLCRPLLLLSSLFPSIRVFSSESALHKRWPKYWNFLHTSYQMFPGAPRGGCYYYPIFQISQLTEAQR